MQDEKDLEIARLNKRIVKLSSLLEINIMMTVIPDIKQLLGFIIQSSKNILEAEAASIILIDEAKGTLFFEAAAGEKAEKVKELQFPVDKGFAGWSAKEGKSVLTNDASADPRFYSEIDKQIGFQTRSVVCVPLSIHFNAVTMEPKIIGAIEVINRLENKEFTGEDTMLLTILANQSAIAIENAMCLNKLSQKPKI